MQTPLPARSWKYGFGFDVKINAAPALNISRNATHIDAIAYKDVNLCPKFRFCGCEKILISDG